MNNDKILLFKKLLTKFIKKSLQRKIKYVTLGTDYAPEYPLSEICQKAGVSGAQFPQKTTMNVNFEKMTVTWYQVRGSEGIIYPE